MKLAKLGYYGGDPQKVLRAPVSMVINIMSYESFESEYKDKHYEINKDE